MPRSITGERMVVITLHLPKSYLNAIDSLVRQGRFPSRSEVIRLAVIDLIKRVKAQSQGSNPPLTGPAELAQQLHGEESTVGGEIVIEQALIDEGGGEVVLKCLGCGYELAVFSDVDVKHLVSVLKYHRARCPRCGSKELILEFKPRKTPKTQAGVAQV